MEPVTLAYVLIVLGALLAVAELAIPSHFVLPVVGICCVLAGVALIFFYGDSTTGLVTLGIVFVAGPALMFTLLYLWPYTPLGRRLVVEPDLGPDATVSTMPGLVGLEALRGRYGRALSALRPSGIVDFDGRRVDTLTEGMMIEAGDWVRCIDVRAGRVVVRRVDPPNLDAFEADDFH